jgi:hypothetical protein
MGTHPAGPGGSSSRSARTTKRTRSSAPAAALLWPPNEAALADGQKAQFRRARLLVDGVHARSRARSLIMMIAYTTSISAEFFLHLALRGFYF